jgi:hypothetical protein
MKVTNGPIALLDAAGMLRFHCTGGLKASRRRRTPNFASCLRLIAMILGVGLHGGTSQAETLSMQNSS